MRRALAHNVRQINKAVAANRNALRLLVHQIVRIDAHSLCGELLLVAEVVAEPLERQARAQRNAHHVPAARNGAAESMYTALGVDRDLGAVRVHNAGRTDRGKRLAVHNNARTDGRSCVVAGTADHRSTLLEARQLGSLCGDIAGDLRGLVHLAQHGLIDVQLLKDLVGPAAVRHVQKLHTGSVRNLSGKFAGEHIADIVLGKQDMAALRVDFRLIVAHPEDLGRGKAGQGGICGDLDQSLPADLLRDLLALLRGTLIAPEDRLAQHFSCLVEHDKAVHLPGKADTRDICVVYSALLHNILNGAGNRIPPVVRVLLRPAVLRLVHRVFHRGRGNYISCRVKQNCFCSGGPNVRSNQIFHCTALISFMCPSTVSIF